MTDECDRAAAARTMIDGNLYLVLATADADGRPWASPVYFAHARYREFYWVSKPGARHSRNLDARADVSMVIFDSTVPISTGQAVYLAAVAEEVVGEARGPALEIFSARGVAHGGQPWTVDDVQRPAAHRLYRATAAEQFVLDEHDERVPVTL